MLYFPYAIVCSQISNFQCSDNKTNLITTQAVILLMLIKLKSIPELKPVNNDYCTFFLYSMCV